MWKRFQEECYGRKTIQSEHGFVLYEYFEEEKSAYIHIMYTKPNCRVSGVAYGFEQEIIEKHNVRHLVCFVDMHSRNPELSLKAILKAGYKISSASPDRIVLYKEVSNG